MASSDSTIVALKPSAELGEFGSSDPVTVLMLSSRFQVRGSCATTLRLLERLPGWLIYPRLICPDAQQVNVQRRRQLQIREISHLDFPILGRFLLRNLLTELQAQPPDVIHVQSRRMLAAGNWLARQLKRPLILTVHDYLRHPECLRVDRSTCRRIVAVSEAVKADLITQTGLPEELMTVVCSGVETGVVTEVQPLETGHVPVVGTAGPLETVKGLPYFLEAAAKVLATGKDVEFLIAGAGPEEKRLRRLAQSLGIFHKVTFVPYLLEFGRSLAAMDIFCLPSLQQGLGAVMLEAMALGRPVIATGVGGVNTIVRDGETGLMVPPSNSEELARHIIELLENPDRARAIGNAARRLVESDYSVDRMVKQFVQIYRDVQKVT